MFFDFDPETQNFLFFSKIKAYRSQNFEVIQKTKPHVVKIHTNNTHAKFQSITFVFGCAVAQKPGKGDDVTF